MKKIIFVSVLTFVFLLPASYVLALTCSSSEVCTSDKSDLYLKNLGKFKYLDWTYTIDYNARFLGKNGYYDFKGKWESIRYTIKGAEVVDYQVSIFDFANKQEALELFSKIILDSDYKIYKNSKGTVYQTKEANGESLFWLQDNIMVSIHANPDAAKKKDFFKKAFKVYSKKIKPQKINELKTNYPEQILNQNITSSKKEISMDLKVNGSDTQISVKDNSVLNISWNSQGAENCIASGNFIPKRDGSGFWGIGDQNLPTNGSLQLLARGYSNNKSVYLPTLRVEVLCSNNIGNINYSQVRDSIEIYVTK